jgi:putative transposase
VVRLGVHGVVVDAFGRRIIGWRTGTSMSTQLVLDAVEQAVWTRQRDGASLDSVVAHTDRGSQYTSIRYTERLAQAGVAASVGSVGNSYDTQSMMVPVDAGFLV